jgi:hypothetical protein
LQRMYHSTIIINLFLSLKVISNSFSDDLLIFIIILLNLQR